MANNKCKECGCYCSGCASNDHDVHLHVEIENLKQRLVERDNHIVTMETNFLNEADKYPSGELMALRDELITWQDKYKRLYEAHRRVQRVNQGLEDKLLRLVDVTETEKCTLTKDVATLSHKLAEANYKIKKLTNENERYKNDVSLAIQFLQCKPGNFVSQKFDTLPNEVQAKVSTYMTNKRKPEEKKINPEMKSIKVPIPTFPPTAMVYSVPKSPSAPRRFVEESDSSSVDIVSAAIMAKVLEERELERTCVKHCDTCLCSKNIFVRHNVSTQTFDNSKTDNKVKSVQVHDYNEPNIVKVEPNIVKVEPNNFLADVKCVKKNKTINVSNNSNNIKSAINKNIKPSHSQINRIEIIEAQHARNEELNVGVEDKVFTQHNFNKTAPSMSDNMNLCKDLINFTTAVNENRIENTKQKVNTSEFCKNKKITKDGCIRKGFNDQSNNLIPNLNEFSNNFNIKNKIEVDKSSSSLNNDLLLQSTSTIINNFNRPTFCEKNEIHNQKLVSTINAQTTLELISADEEINNTEPQNSFDCKHLQNFNYLSSNITNDYQAGIKLCTNLNADKTDNVLNKSIEIIDVALNPAEISIFNEKLKQDEIRHTLHGNNRTVTNTLQDSIGSINFKINGHQLPTNNYNSNVQSVSNNILLDNIEDYKPKVCENTELNMEKYKEMEDNVKKFLFGEVNIVSTLNVGKCNSIE